MRRSCVSDIGKSFAQTPTLAPPSLRGAILFPKDSPAPRRLTHETGSCTRPTRNHLKVSHNPSKSHAKSHPQYIKILELPFAQAAIPSFYPSLACTRMRCDSKARTHTIAVAPLNMAESNPPAQPAAAAPAEKLHKDEVTGEMMSKSKLKALQKKREQEKKKQEKAAAMPSRPKAEKKEAEVELNPNQYFELRSQKINALRASKSPNPSVVPMRSCRTSPS